MNELFYEIFSNLPRQGPGDKRSTLKAAKTIEDIPKEPVILDLGCGTGKQTSELAKFFEGKITAIDNHQPFLDVLANKAKQNGFEERLLCLNADMLNPSFVDGQFDLIWAEGSIFIIGFEKGLKTLKKLLKPSGYTAITEVSWFKESPPTELEDFWNSAYPDIKTIDQNLERINRAGYKLIDHFKLPDAAWMDDYYIPLEKRLEKFRQKYHAQKNAIELIASIQLEIDIFRKYSDYYGYVFYIMQNRS